MGADFEFTINSSGQPQLLFIDKGNKKVNVGSKLSDFIIKRKLGEGNFGSVSLVESKITNKVYALKEIRGDYYDNEAQRLEVEREIKLLENLNHPHVIKYFTSFTEKGNFYIVTEYINGGSLEDLYKDVRKEGKFIREKLIWDFLIQALSGLVYLHEDKKIIHRDIKPDNLLLDKENGLKISDFGVSAINKQDADELTKCHGTRIGPIPFMSPEMTEGGTFEFKNDIYMLGLTFYFMLTGKLPEEKARNIFDNSIQIIKKKDSMEIIPEVYSKDIKNFIDKLLTWEAGQRPSARRAFAEAISYYTIKYLGITSILASLQCFFAIPSIGPYFSSEKIKEKIKNDEAERKYLITRIIKDAFECANPNNYNYEQVKIQCWKIRTVFYTGKDETRKSREVDSTTIIEDICNKLHRELNKSNVTKSQNSETNEINEKYIDDSGKKIDEADEQTVITLAVKKFGENFMSKISDQLYFLIKTIYQCPECQKNIKYLTTFHCATCLHPGRCAAWLNKTNIDISDLFKHRIKTRLYSDMNMNCKYCSKKQNRINITRKFYTSPLNFIMGFEYSDESQFIYKIEENIDLSEFIERTDICKTKYRLVGAIFLEKDDDDKDIYISYTKDANGQWKYCNKNNIKNSDFNELQNHKNIKSLFYTSS